MLNRLTPDNYPAYFKGKTVCFIGRGESHNALIEQFTDAGAIVTVRDKATDGDSYLDRLHEEIIFRTPGVRFDEPKLLDAMARGQIVTNETELLFLLCRAPIIAVTGSDGKTTTSTLIAKMLLQSCRRVHLGGNIGTALLPIVSAIEPNDIAVVELSSFQLISMRRSPDVAVITNMSPNHLDMHKDLDDYYNAKKHILLHQSSFAKAVLNLDNEMTASLAALTRGRVEYFSRQSHVAFGACIDDGNVCYNGKPLFPVSEIKLPGVHNAENYLAAIAAVGDMVSVSDIRHVANNFAGVAHRMELILEENGVRYYNDSVASSPSRATAGLRSFEQKVIMIAGGYDKRIPYEPLAPVILKKVSVLVLMGDTAPKIESAVRRCEGFADSGIRIETVRDMESAVTFCKRIAEPGDVVMLCPASASFDKYKNFAERGEHFRRLTINDDSVRFAD